MPTRRGPGVLTRLGVPAYLVQRDEGSHLDVSTAEAILGEVAEHSTNWIDAALTGTRPHVKRCSTSRAPPVPRHVDA